MARGYLENLPVYLAPRLKYLNWTWNYDNFIYLFVCIQL